MSLGHANVKIGVEVDGKKVYLSDIQITGAEEPTDVDYTLNEEGQVYPNSEATVLLPMLRKLKPGVEFLVEGVDTEE